MSRAVADLFHGEQVQFSGIVTKSEVKKAAVERVPARLRQDPGHYDRYRSRRLTIIADGDPFFARVEGLSEKATKAEAGNLVASPRGPGPRRRTRR